MWLYLDTKVIQKKKETKEEPKNPKITKARGGRKVNRIEPIADYDTTPIESVAATRAK